MRDSLLLIVILLVACILVNASSFYYGRYLFKQSDVKTTDVTTTIILDRIKNNYFVVTKTVFLDEDTTIEIKEGSRWNNLLWGHNINAEATIRVDVGVDMNKLTSDKIKVDEVTKKVIIDLPDAEILDTSLFGEMKIETKSGILKQLFENDKSDDFNLALEQLRDKAEKAVIARPEIYDEAKKDSINLISLIVEGLGYQVEII
jgi:hypothetical protein